MGKAKPMKLPTEQTTRYQEWRPSETQDTQAARGISAIPESIAPGMQAMIDRQQQMGNQQASTNYSSNMPDVSRRIMQGMGQMMGTQQYGSQLSGAANEALQNNFLRRLALAQMTIGRPLTSQTSGYTSAPTESIWKSVLQGVGAASGGLMQGMGGKMGGGARGATGGTSGGGGSYYYG